MICSSIPLLSEVLQRRSIQQRDCTRRDRDVSRFPCSDADRDVSNLFS